MASGRGSNFEALARALKERPAGRRHDCVLLVHDRRAAPAAERAAGLSIPSIYIRYPGRSAEEAEAEIAAALDEAGADLVALAGFMRLLSPAFVAARRGRIVNIHPSLLPKWPGARAIERAYEAGEGEFGVTVHFVDEGMDSGQVIDSSSFCAEAPRQGLEEIEARIHALEHKLYPRTVLSLLDAIDGDGERR